MSLIIIPDPAALGAAAKQEAQGKFTAAIDDPVTANLIVYGEGAEVDAILEQALARAQLRPFVRQVVWVKNAEVLTSSQQKTYFRAGKAVIAVNLADKICAELSIQDGQRTHKIEMAFTKAEKLGT